MKRFNLPLAITMVSWAFNFVALKVVYESMSPPAVAWWRWVAMCLALVPLCWLRGTPLRYRSVRDFWMFMAAGTLSMGLYMVFFIGGMALTTPAEGAIILAASPILTYLFASAVRLERFVWGALAGAALAFAGVATVVLGAPAGGTHGTFLGNMLILGSAVLWSTSVILMRPVLVEYDPLQALTLSMPGGMVPLLIYGGAAAWQVPWADLSLNAWLMFGHVALISGVLAFICFYEGIRQIGPAGAQFYQFTVPPMAAVFGWLVLGQRLGPIQGVGFVAVLAGVYWAQRSRAGNVRA